MRPVTVLPGDAPELVAEVRGVVDSSGAKVRWEEADPSSTGLADAIRKNRVALRGPHRAGRGEWVGRLRRQLDLFAGLRPLRSFEGVGTPGGEVDLVLVRENLEDLLAGPERPAGPDAAEAVRRLTREGCRRLARAAFDYAAMHARRRITVVHRADALPLTDGLFLQVAREAARDYAQLQLEDRAADDLVLDLVRAPGAYDVLLSPGLYGGILAHLGAGLVGGPGLAPAADMGPEAALFGPAHALEPGFLDPERPNPAALLLSAVMLLERLNEHQAAERIRRALEAVLAEGRIVTPDLGGGATPAEMCAAVAARLRPQP